MTEWLVALQGERFDLEQLLKLFDSPEATVLMDDDNYYLKSTDFDDLSTAQDVREKAYEIVARINGASFLHFPDMGAIEVGHVTEVREDGRRNHYVLLAGSIKSRGRVGIVTLTVKDAGGNEIESHQPSPAQTTMEVARQHKDVADALRFFRKEDWVSLYKVFEIVEESVGDKKQIRQLSGLSVNSLDRFTQTAQSRAAIADEARHGKEIPAPKRPMTFAEARELIRKIVESWIQSKSA